MSPLDSVLDALRSHGCDPRRNGDGWSAKCPAHDDRHPSLSVSEGHDGRVLLKCHAGDVCDFTAIAAALGLAETDFFPPKQQDNEWEVVATFVYTDEQGELLFRVVRTAGKKFWQERRNGSGWTKGLDKKTRRVLYRLPEVLAAVEDGRWVLIPEGEKHCDRLAESGVCATTNPMGAKKWRDQYTEPLRGAKVCVLADNDYDGRTHARQVATSLHGKAKLVKVIELDGLPAKGDVLDWLDAGHDVAELKRIIADAPEWKPTAKDGELPDLELDPEQAKTFAELVDQLKGLDEGEQKGAMKALTQLLGSRSQSTELVQLALDAGVELWRDPEGVGYATIPVDDHVEHWPVRSRSFRLWLRRRYWEEEESAPNANAVRDTIEVLDGKALFAGDEHHVHVRVAEHEGAVYLDLCDDGWRSVEITSAGWTVRNGAPVRFKRTPGMLPLPVPEPGGSIAGLRAFVNVTDDDWPLLLGWLLGALRPKGPYVVLNLTGEHGSAKTTVCRVLRRMLDPNTADDRAAPRDTRDLMIAAANGWICAFDNLSWLRQGLSDDLARLSTGAGFSVRKLYENDEEQLFSACRPIILTGIEDVVTRPDLLDRTIVIEPPRLAKKTAEKVFWAGFDEARPALLGALLDAVTAARAGEDHVTIDDPPRMVDFARWVTAAEDTLGIEDFVGKYRASWHRAQGLALEGDDAANAIYKEAIRRTAWTATAGEIAETIKPEHPPKDWPTTGVKIAGLLRRIVPVLRLHGVDVSYNEHERPRTWILRCDLPPDDTDGTDKLTDPPSDPGDQLDTSAVALGPAGGGTDRDADSVGQSGTDSQTDDPDTPSDQERSQSVSSVSPLGDEPDDDDGRDYEAF